MLPAEVSAYVAMHLEMPELATFTGLKRFTLKYVRVLQKLKRKTSSRPANLVEQDSQDAPPQSYLEAAMAPPAPPDLELDFDFSSLDGLEPQAQIEVLAVMAKQGYRFKRPQGAGGRPPPRTGAPQSALVTSLVAARRQHPGVAGTFLAPTAVGKATLRLSAGSLGLNWLTTNTRSCTIIYL